MQPNLVVIHDALHLAVLDGFHKFAGAVTVGVGAGLLVGIHFDGGGFDTEGVGRVFASALALACEILIGGADATVE